MPNGSRYERELKKELERRGFFVVRSAGSFATDLIAIKKGGSPIGLEIKSCNRKTYYLTTRAKEQVKELKKLKRFGIEAVFAVRFKRKGVKKIKNWRFLRPKNVRNSVKSDAESDFVV